MKRYIFDLLISVDQLLNAILGGFPDETLSSRMGKKAEKGNKAAIYFCSVLDIFEKDHCAKSIERDEGNRWEV